jgi:hypothetical protein
VNKEIKSVISTLSPLQRIAAPRQRRGHYTAKAQLSTYKGYDSAGFYVCYCASPRNETSYVILQRTYRNSSKNVKQQFVSVKGILAKAMRKRVRSTIAITLSLLLAAMSAALTYSAPLSIHGNFSSGESFYQTTPTPQSEDTSEIGSTNEIVVMGGVIVLIIVIPILLRRKSWKQS